MICCNEGKKDMFGDTVMKEGRTDWRTICDERRKDRIRGQSVVMKEGITGLRTICLEGRTGLEHNLFVMKKGRTGLADNLCVR